MKAKREVLRVVVSTNDGRPVSIMTLVDAMSFRDELDKSIHELADAIDIKLAPMTNRGSS